MELMWEAPAGDVVIIEPQGTFKLHLWCVPCGFTHEFDPEQVEMLVYALAYRLGQHVDEEIPQEFLDFLNSAGPQRCLLGNVEATSTETQAVVLRNVQRREAE